MSRFKPLTTVMAVSNGYTIKPSILIAGKLNEIVMMQKSYV